MRRNGRAGRLIYQRAGGNVKPTQTVLSLFGLRPRRIGGIEVFCRELSRQLADLGWQSLLVFQSLPPAFVRGFLELPNVAFEVVERSHETGRRPASDLARILRKYRPAVAHFQFTPLLGPYPWLARLLSAKRVFITDHASRPLAAKRRALWKRLCGRLISLPVDKLLCISRFTYEYDRVLGYFPPRQLEVLYNGVDVSRPGTMPSQARDIRRRYGVPEDAVLVSQVSQLIPEKGIDDLIQAAKLTLAHNKNVHFLLVGDGPEYGRYRAMIGDLDLQSRVSLTGLIEDPIGEGLYAASDMVCQVSRWGEAFGFTIAEAMASGRPVIATRVGAIPELVRDGHSGFLVEVGDVNAMAERLLLLARSPELRASMGVIGRQICEKQFDVVRQVASLIRMYGICRTEHGPCRVAGRGFSETSRARSSDDHSQSWTWLGRTAN